MYFVSGLVKMGTVHKGTFKEVKGLQRDKRSLKIQTQFHLNQKLRIHQPANIHPQKEKKTLCEVY